MAWDQYISEGAQAVRAGDYEGAEKLLKLALHFASENFSRNDSRLAMTLSLLGHTYFKTHDFTRSELLLEQSIKLHFQADSLDNTCLLMDIFSLGEIKVGQGKRAEACRLYGQAVKRLEPVLTSESPAIGKLKKLYETYVAMLSYTEHLQILRPELLEYLSSSKPEVETDYEEALRKVESVCNAPAADIRHEANDTTGSGSTQDAPKAVQAETSQPAVGSSVELLFNQQLQAGLAALEAEDDEREKLITAYLNLESALRLGQRLYAYGDARRTSAIKVLADASARLKMFAQAESLYREAISSAKQGGESQQANIAALRLSLAVFYANFDQLRQAKKILEDVKPPADLATCDYGSGLLKNIEKAKQLITIYDSVQNLVRQAQSAEDAGDIAKASKQLNTALSILRQGFAPNHPEQARVLRYRAKLLEQLGQQEQSRELGQRADRIERANEAALNDWTKVTDDLPKPALGVPA